METLHCRRNLATLDFTEKRKFRDAVFQLIDNGQYQKYIDLHGYVSNLGHSGPAFLPWHRAFLLSFEQDLRTIDASLTIPYWDFGSANLDDGGNSHIWTDDLFGGAAATNGGEVTISWTDSGGMPQSITIRRRSFNETAVPVTSGITDALSLDIYGTIEELGAPNVGFRKRLERGAHGAAHVFLGVPGSQGGIPGLTGFHTAVEDPVFILLHANIDRLWSMWQQRMKKEWLTANPGLSYPASQSADDYHFDAATIDTTWPPPSASGISRHNLDDDMWPWDGSEDGSHQVSSDSSSFAPWNLPGQAISYTPRNMLGTLDLGYMYDDDTPIVDLTTASVNFSSIPEGDVSSAAAVFDIRSCMTEATFEIVSGPGSDFGIPDGGSTMTFTPTLGSEVGEVRFWFIYPNISSPGASFPPAGTTASGNVTIRCIESQEQWVIPLNATVVPRPTVATSLVLDRSGSMGANAGLGNSNTRMDVLQMAAPIFVDMLRAQDGIAVASFNHDATPDMPLQLAGPSPVLGGKGAARTAISSLTVGGATSIGDGIESGSDLLAGAAGFDDHALVVFTDGHENNPKTIAEVAGSLDARAFAIGLGTPSQLLPAALDSIVNSTGGYMVMTGDPNVDLLRLGKYFLQILAGVTNNEIILDPPGRLKAGDEHRIPLVLGGLDSAVDVITILPRRGLFHISLETPNGQIIEPGNVNTVPGASYTESDHVSFYRLTLPAVLNGKPGHAGKWHATLKVDDQNLERHLERLKEMQDHKEIELTRALGAPYEFVVQARSSLKMEAIIIQKSYEVGAEVNFNVILTEAGMPLSGPSRAWIEIAGPKNIRDRIKLQKRGNRFTGSFNTELPGSYQMRVLARGQNFRGQPFDREQLRTVSVWNGGDKPIPKSPEDLPRPSDVESEGNRNRHEVDSRPNVPDLTPPLRIDMEHLRELLRNQRTEINLLELFTSD